MAYHLVCAAKYRRVVMSRLVDETVRDVCLEIGMDGDHAHFLLQSVPTYSPSRIVQRVKSVTARAVFAIAPEVNP